MVGWRYAALGRIRLDSGGGRGVRIRGGGDFARPLRRPPRISFWGSRLFGIVVEPIDHEAPGGPMIRASSVACTMAVAFACLANGCTESPHGANQNRSSAPPSSSVAVIVGATRIPVSLVANVASVESKSPSEAARAVAEDALLAEAAKERSLDKTLESARATTAILARATLDTLKKSANATPLSEAEITELSKEKWRDVDLPETREVVHAVVLRPKKETAESLAKAKELADQLHAKVANVTSADEFESLVNTIPHAPSEIVVERLPFFTAEGKMVSGDGELDATFSKAAFQLAPKKTSAIVETSFGWHVIWLNEIRAPHHVPTEERAALFHDEIVNRRVRAEIGRIVERAKKETPIEISGAAESILNDFFLQASNAKAE